MFDHMDFQPKAAIAQRQVYPLTTAEGLTVFDHGGNAKARAEIDAVTDEILSSLGATGGSS